MHGKNGSAYLFSYLVEYMGITLIRTSTSLTLMLWPLLLMLLLLFLLRVMMTLGGVRSSGGRSHSTAMVPGSGLEATHQEIMHHSRGLLFSVYCGRVRAATGGVISQPAELFFVPKCIGNVTLHYYCHHFCVFNVSTCVLLSAFQLP